MVMFQSSRFTLVHVMTLWYDIMGYESLNRSLAVIINYCSSNVMAIQSEHRGRHISILQTHAGNVQTLLLKTSFGKLNFCLVCFIELLGLEYGVLFKYQFVVLA